MTTAAHWKRWFRFSLRTLLLAVLLIGSAALLWWNWGPWAPAYTVESPSAIENVNFSPDDRFVIFRTQDGDPDAKETKHRLDIRHAASGAPYGILLLPHEVSYEVFDAGRLWCPRFVTENEHTRILAPLVYDLQSLQPLDTGNKFDSEKPSWVEHAGEFALHKSDEANVLMRWPDLHVVESFPPGGGTRMLKENIFCVHRPEGLERRPGPPELFDAMTGRSVKLDAVVGQPETVAMALAGSRFMLTTFTYDKSDRREWFHVFDATTGRHLSTREGFLRHCSPDGAFAVIHTKLHEAPYVLNLQTGDTVIRYEKPSPETEISTDSSLFLEHWTCRMYETKSFSLLWEKPDSWGQLHPHFVWGMRKEGSHPWLAELRTGRTLLDFSTARWRNCYPDKSSIAFDKNNPNFAILKENRATIFRLRRPIEWYGFFWLPEFWAALVLTVLLLWSILRDRHEPQPQGSK